MKTFTGTAPDAQTESETWYYRGMSDDNDTTAVTLIDSQNGQHDDTNALAGQTLETAQYFYASTSTTPPVASSTIDAYWISPVIASRTRTGLPALIAQRVEPDETWTRSAITDASPSTWSETAQVTTYDATTTDASFGLPLYQYATGDLALVGTAHSQETCNETTYTAPNTNLNLVALVAETRSVDEACGGTSAIGSSTPTAPTGSQINGLTAPSSVNLATDVIEDTRTFYDNPTMASTWPQPSSPTWPQSAPNTPQVSVTQAANGYDSTSGQLTYITKAASLYDSYNRPVTDYDAMGDESQFAYTMTSYGTVTATTTTNALGQAQSTTLDPARALVLTVTDANGVTTTTNYDGLGRSIAVWDDGRATSSTANALYTYAISNNAAPTVTTETLDDESFPVKSVEIYDSLLRPRESQTQAVSTTAGRIITDTIYDTHGWVVKQNTNYYDSSTNPDTTLGSVPDNKVADQTVTAYDGLGRAVEVQHLNNTATPVVDDISYTQYTGDKTTNVPPTGGVAQTTVTDALGRTTELDQYSESPTVTTGTSGGFTTATVTGGTTLATTYGYNTHGLQASITDANNDMWSTTYDFLGQVYTSTDPDAGTTTTLYDAQGRVSQTTDNAGNILSYSYDALGRKIAEYNAAATNQQPYVSAASPGNEVASWIYDNRNSVAGVTHAIGQLTAQNAYTSAGVFTTQAINFNVFGESLGESYTIPNTNVNTATLAGTYTYKHSYTTTTGLPKQTSIPAAGGMASEITTTGYSQYDGVDVVTALNGVNSDLANVNYTQWGQIAELQLGNASVTSPNALVDYTYDQLTGAPLTSSVTNTAVSGTAMDKTGYTYDASGNPTSATETRSGTATETQCYTYDPLDRLTNAWTAAGSCAALPTSANETTTIGDQISGGAYWTSWTFDNIGQFKTQTQHSPTGGTDTTTTDFYGTNTTGNCSGQAGGGAHTLNATTTIGPSGTQGAIYCSNSIGQTTSMPSSTGQNSLNWNPEGQLQQVTTAAGASTYLYDAAGNLVERTDPGTVTVYLPGQQIAFNSSTQTTTTTRSIALPGGTQVVETGNTGNYRYEVANAQGTATISLDSTLQHPTYQQYTPYGAPRGTTPAPWTDPNGYLGKVQDPADNLVTMGARQYAPTLGRFVSLDPVLEATDPQQLNGYTYAGANPITGSDPTGTTKCDADPELCPGSGGSTTSTTTNNGSGNTGSTGGSTGSTGGSTGSSTPMQCSGLHGKLAALCEGGTTDQQVCDATCLQIQQFSAACSAKGGQDENGTCTFPPPPKPHHWWETALLVVAAVIIVAVVIAVIVNPLLLVPALVAAGESFGTATAGGATLGLGVFAGAAAAGATVATAAGATALGVGLGVAAVLAGGSYEGSGGESCESFTASTQVVMADGKKKAIDAVKPGDKIQAKNTNTLKSETQTVEAVNVNHDTDIYDLIIHTKHGNAVIHATANHPIWDETTRSWVVAEELHRGDQLLTNDGSQATFLGGITPKITTGWMWDLSVSSDHDFYVVAGSTPVLVHNCAPEFVSNAQAGLAGKRVTTGRIFDADGNPLGVEDKVHELTAGSDGLSPQTSAYLHEAAGNGNLEPINPRFRYPQDTHVESKYATWMRNNSVTDADVVINHPNGICSNALNCADAIPAILPQNSVMRVWAPGATEPVEFWGTA